MCNADPASADGPCPNGKARSMVGLTWEHVVEVDGHLHAIDAHGRRRAIRDLSGGPIARFARGWAARGLLRLGDAGAVIDLVHTEGGTAAWVFDGEDRFVADRPWQSRKAARNPDWVALRPGLSAALAPITETMLRDPLALLSDPDFAALQRLTASAGVGLLASTVPPAFTTLPLPAAGTPDTHADLPGRLREVFQLNWVAWTRTMFRTGKMSMPSLTGPGEAWRVGVVRLNLGTCLIQVQDAPGQRTWVASLHAGKWTARGGLNWILLPDGRTMVSPTGSLGPQAGQELNLLLAYYAAAGHAIGPWFSNPVGPALAYRPANGNHLGHLIWNDLSAVQDLLGRCARSERSMVVYDLSVPPGADIYGIFGQIFPELASSARRPPQHDHMVNVNAFVAATREQRHLLNFRLAEVPTALRERILRSVHVDPVARAVAPLAPLRLDRSGRSPRRPVIALGLRLQNRTVLDKVSLYERIVRHLCITCAPEGLGVVVDGMNALPGHPAATLDPGRLIGLEAAFVEDLRHRLADLPVELVSCVGMTMAENLVWLSQADMFVAPQGGGLVKYRWVHNIPGYVLTSAINLRQSKRVYLYSHRGGTESPSPFLCNLPEDVEDQFPPGPDGMPLVTFEGAGGLSSVNFRILNPDRILTQIEEMFRTACAPGNAPPVG